MQTIKTTEIQLTQQLIVFLACTDNMNSHEFIAINAPEEIIEHTKCNKMHQNFDMVFFPSIIPSSISFPLMHGFFYILFKKKILSTFNRQQFTIGFGIFYVYIFCFNILIN